MKHKVARLLFALSFIIVLLILALYTIAVPSVISGDPIPPFENKQYILSEKITYVFSAPKLNDVVMFFPDDNNQYIGAIVAIDSSYYKIISGYEDQRAWVVTKDQIKSRVYWPTSRDYFAR